MIGLGRHAEAAKLLEGCLERSRESLGAQHPETFKAAWQLLIAESRGRDARGRVRELFANDLSPLMQCAPERLPPETAAAIKQAGIARVGLLGTRFTMEQDFYRGRLAERHGIEVLIPAAKDRDLVHRVIYEELCLGLFDDASRTAYLDVMARLVTRGAEAIILGCTEISLLVGPRDTDIPLFDTTAIHARAAAERAFRGER
jgi:aspartate racemase